MTYVLSWLLSDRNLRWLYGINISGFVALMYQQVNSQRNSGRQKKHVFGSSVGCRVSRCQTIVCVFEVLAYEWKLRLL
jgi:hypothetical protein